MGGRWWEGGTDVDAEVSLVPPCMAATPKLRGGGTGRADEWADVTGDGEVGGAPPPILIMLFFRLEDGLGRCALCPCPCPWCWWWEEEEADDGWRLLP
jgi:hypothetical protein